MTSTSIQAIVLSDGKPGHYNQSLGVIQSLPGCSWHWIHVNFRGKRRDNLLRVLTCLFGGFRLPHGLIRGCLRLALRQEVLEAISAVKHADVILSTGSSVASVNLLIGQLFNARTVTCRRPSPVGIAYFDLAILPKMQWPRRDKSNICKTIGVPNQISPEKVNARREQLQADLNLSEQRRIGVLVGGEDRYHTLTEQTATHLIDVLQEVAAKLDCQLLLTTSRRTPLAVENLIGARLSDAKRCPILVLAHRENSLADPIGTIFALSELIVVTEDSFSMVCEAASSGRRVLILEVEHKTRRRPKHSHVYTELTRRTSVRWCGIKDLEENIRQMLADKTPIEPLQDTQIAATVIRQLVDESNR